MCLKYVKDATEIGIKYNNNNNNNYYYYYYYYYY